MKILVAIKRVPDTDQRIVVSPSGVIDDQYLPFVINPFDAIALEEAVQISEARENEVEVVAVGIGSAEYEEQLRTALAMGADRAIHVLSDDELGSWNVARILREVVRRENPDLVLMGKQAVDDDAGQAGQFLAAVLDWPQATFASDIELRQGGVCVTREVDEGLETLELTLPAVITVDLRLNEPRYASLAGILAAKKKQIEETGIVELGVDIAPPNELLALRSAGGDRQCRRVPCVDDLVTSLRSDKAIP